VARSFLILHGRQGSGPGHWQTWLAGRLRGNGEHVAYPDLPDADAPMLEQWLHVLAGEIGALPGEHTVLCHSLACVLWLHHVERGGRQADRLLLVAPPAEQESLGSFFPAPLPRLEHEARIACSDDDPYCPAGAAVLYGEALGIPVDLLPGAGHVNADSGFGPWPEVEAWCLGQGDSAVTSSRMARG
jgi:uncharacterized protein